MRNVWTGPRYVVIRLTAAARTVSRRSASDRNAKWAVSAQQEYKPPPIGPARLIAVRPFFHLLTVVWLMPRFAARPSAKVVTAVAYSVLLKLVEFWLSPLFTGRLVAKKCPCYRSVSGLLGLLFVYQPFLSLPVWLVYGPAKIGKLRQLYVPPLLVDDPPWPLPSLPVALLISLIIRLVALF